MVFSKFKITLCAAGQFTSEMFNFLGSDARTNVTLEADYDNSKSVCTVINLHTARRSSDSILFQQEAFQQKVA